MKVAPIFLGLGLALTGEADFAQQQDVSHSLMSSDELYARQVGQVFKAPASLTFKIGFLEGGDDEPYLTWSGRLSGKPIYVEIHGDSLRLKVGRVWRNLKFSATHRLKDDFNAELDVRKGVDLYVHAAKKANDSLICMESLPPEDHLHVPLRSVYVITHALTRPVLYQLPAIYGSCRGLVSEKGQSIMAPYWAREYSSSSRFTIQYLPLISTGFGEPTGKSTVVINPQNESDRFELEKP